MKDDLISRQAAIKTAHFPVIDDAGYEVVRVDDIMALPSAQPEIVRCKDCKEFRRWIDTDITFCDCTEYEVKADDFCSKAERRTDG